MKQADKQWCLEKAIEIIKENKPILFEYSQIK